MMESLVKFISKTNGGSKMIRIIPVVAVLLLLIACDHKPAPVAKAQKDPKIAAIEERISKTTPEGKEIIEKVKAMKAEVNEQLSTKTLKEMGDHYEKEMGAYNITSIGWEGSQKKLLPGAKSPRWKVAFSYQDWQKQLLVAEWEYDADTKKVYPFEKDNAPQFWSNEGAEPQGKKGKK
jgi:hypothetical protein